MSNWDWFALVGYLIVAGAFSLTMYATVIEYARRKHGEAIVRRRRWFYNITSALIGASWPVTLPICTVLATAAVMAGRKR